MKIRASLTAWAACMLILSLAPLVTAEPTTACVIAEPEAASVSTGFDSTACDDVTCGVAYGATVDPSSEVPTIQPEGRFRMGGCTDKAVCINVLAEPASASIGLVPADCADTNCGVSEGVTVDHDAGGTSIDPHHTYGISGCTDRALCLNFDALTLSASLGIVPSDCTRYSCGASLGVVTDGDPSTGTSSIDPLTHWRISGCPDMTVCVNLDGATMTPSFAREPEGCMSYSCGISYGLLVDNDPSAGTTNIDPHDGTSTSSCGTEGPQALP